MRLSILQSGHSTRARVILEQAQRQLGTDIIPGSRATLLYRPEFFGKPFGDYLDDVMRGPSSWTVGERELFAAFVSKLNQCPW